MAKSIKKVVILFAKKIEKGKRNGLREGYEYLFNLAREKDVELYIARISDYRAKSNDFKKTLFFSGKRWIQRKDIKPDLVYNRSKAIISEPLSKKRKTIEQKNEFLNNLGLEEVLNDKWKTYQRFKKYSPKAFLIRNEGDIKKIERLKAERIILKPQFGYAGKGIKIIRKNSFRKIKFPFIAQEMIETSGMGNIVKGPHDLRILLINNKPFYSFIRIPAKGKLIANIFQGGKRKNVPINRIPVQAKNLIKKVSLEVGNYKRNFYSIDIIFDNKQTPWIIELNSRPGIAMVGTSKKEKKTFYTNLINFFS